MSSCQKILSSGDLFESKISDVVRGTAKALLNMIISDDLKVTSTSENTVISDSPSCANPRF